MTGLIDWDTILTSFQWDMVHAFFDHFIVPSLMSLAVLFGVQKGFDLLKERVKYTWFTCSLFFVFVVCSFTLYSSNSDFELAGEASQVMFGGSIKDVSGNNIENKNAIIQLTILNPGKQTIVRCCHVSVKFGSDEYLGQVTFLPPETGDLHLRSRSGKEMSLPVSNQIVNKMASPIPSGGELAGFLFVSFNNVPVGLFTERDPEFLIKFKDIRNNEYKVHINPSGRTDEMFYLPGTALSAQEK